MLRGIQLQRFRGFAALTAELGPITAIVGKNSSGKTSILHAVRLVCEALALALEDDDARPRLVDGHIEVCREVVVTDPTRLVALADWRQLFMDGEVGEGVTLSIKLVFEASDSVQDASLVLAYGRNAQLKMSIDVASEDAVAAVAGVAIRSARRPTRLREELRRIIPVAVFVPAFYGVTRLEEYRTLPVVTRLLGAGDQSHIVRNLLARMDGGALERLNGFLRRAVGAEIVQRVAQSDAEQRDNLAVTYRDTNGELELSSAGAGLVGLVALYAAMERTRAVRERGRSVPVMFLLDEPEAHLHPRLQGDVGEELAKLATEFGLQLVLATHSIEMINRLARRPESLLMTVDRSAGTVEVLRSESDTIRALDEFCDLTPFASLSFLASRRILFYEGPSDRDVLEACARLQFRNDDVRARRYRQYTQVALDGVGNASMTTLLRKLLTPSMFARIDPADPVRAAVALDRDWVRTPRKASVTPVAQYLRIIDATWSRYSIESLFLEPAILAGWLSPHLDRAGTAVEGTVLQAAIAEAIRAADRDEALNDEAIAGRMPFHRRPDAEHKINTERIALARAREEVRADPGAWQSGKPRAAFILAAVRKALGKPGHALRGGLTDLIANAPTDSLGDPTLLVPDEVRAFLDALVTT
jgi:predicted ATPase